MAETIWKDQTFQVLRVVPTTPANSEDEVVAKLDLIHVEYKLLLFDCELRLVDGAAEAHVKVPDLRILLGDLPQPPLEQRRRMAAKVISGRLTQVQSLREAGVAKSYVFATQLVQIRAIGK